MEFNPERFLNADGTLNSSVRDPDVAAFGYGRRYAVIIHGICNYLLTMALIGCFSNCVYKEMPRKTFRQKWKLDYHCDYPSHA